MRRLLLLFALGFTLAPLPTAAHTFEYTRAYLTLAEDGSFRIDLGCDLDALALGASPLEDSARLAKLLVALPEADREKRIERLKGFFQRRIRVKGDGDALKFAVSFPERSATPRLVQSEPDSEPAPSLLGLVARLEGEIPEGVAEITFRASSSFPPVVFHVTEEATGNSDRQWLAKGLPSSPFLLGQTPPPPDPFTVAERYVALGFLHILPKGLDHILFVLGLFLLGKRFAPLLWQVTAFTAAHTVSLALSTLGIVSLSPNIVEPLIALSIAYVAIENLLTAELKPWRPAVVFAFGLLHGLGFAGVLDELGLPEGRLVPSLLGFNIGVEIGQLAVLGLAFLAVGWYRKSPNYRRRVVVPGSLAIAAMGLYWTVQRIIGG